MEQLSRARPCGCQDMGQIARTGFRSSWLSQYAGETDVRPEEASRQGMARYRGSPCSRGSPPGVLSEARVPPFPPLPQGAEVWFISFGKTQRLARQVACIRE